MRTFLVIAAIVVGAFFVISFGHKVVTDPQPGPGHSGSVAVSLKTMQTYRTITVSPTSANCTNYAGGQYPNRSKGAMGFPNGTCQVGEYLKGKDPIKIRYDGFQGYVYVHAGWAMPDSSTGSGTPWHPCAFNGHKQVRCVGTNGNPGEDQYLVRNFSPEGQPTPVTGNNVCDVNFRPAHGCYASRGNAQYEGFYVTGPRTIPATDTAQTWTFWVIWTAVPPGTRK